MSFPAWMIEHYRGKPIRQLITSGAIIMTGTQPGPSHWTREEMAGRHHREFFSHYAASHTRQAHAE